MYKLPHRIKVNISHWNDYLNSSDVEDYTLVFYDYRRKFEKEYGMIYTTWRNNRLYFKPIDRIKCMKFILEFGDIVTK